MKTEIEVPVSVANKDAASSVVIGISADEAVLLYHALLSINRERVRAQVDPLISLLREALQSQQPKLFNPGDWDLGEDFK
jgi:hypothetical protein